MNFIASGMLIIWFPIIVLVFTAFPPRKAIPPLFVTAWLLLPNGGFSLPGIPDYTKMTATVFGVVFCSIFFDSGRLFSLRFRWYDLPIVIWGFEVFVTAVVNGLGPYEGLAATIDFLFWWGFPYIIGRLYLNDPESLKDYSRAIIVGGLCYIPLCLLELRISPMLHLFIYGFYANPTTFLLRYNGYRPAVFLATGLELGMWMTNASLMAFALWSSGTIKNIRGISMGRVTLALVAMSILCKSTGALVLLMVGIGVLWITRRFGKTWLIWSLIAIPPTYCFTRALNLWQGQELLDLTTSTVGSDRAQSLEFRFQMERLLADHAMERPIFGWGRMGRNLIFGSGGRPITVPDGFWVIQLGVYGVLGLSCLLAMFLLPMILTLRRYPISTWRNPTAGSVIGLSMIILLSMIDFLSNSMMTPLFPLAIGGLLTQPPYRREGGHDEAVEALASASEYTMAGLAVEATDKFHQAIELASEVDDITARQVQAEALDGLGQNYMALGDLERSSAAFREAVIIRDELASQSPDDENFRDLAIARDGLSRALAEAGQFIEAIEERQHALQIWKILADNHRKNLEYREQHVNTLNDLAWLLVTNPDLAIQGPGRALALIEEAVSIAPDHDALWNTLGVVRYRIGDWAGSIEALEKSAQSTPDGAGTAFDHYFLAMAWSQLHRDDLAEEWFERAVAWTARHRPDHLALRRFRDEAWSILHQDA